MAAKGGSSKRAADLQRSMTDNTPSKLSTKVARLTNTPKSSLRTQNQQKTGPDMDKITLINMDLNIISTGYPSSAL